MQTYKLKWFARFARREQIVDASLKEAIARAELGLIDADLGGGLIKQRIAQQGKGRSGGYRVIVAYRSRKRAVFLLGFAKNEQDNIEPDELQSLREFGEKWLAASSAMIRESIEDGALVEVEYDEKE